MIFCALLSLSFELLQWIFAIGASDITDWITNTVGGILGAEMYFVLEKMFKSRAVLIVSIIGAILEVLFISLIIVLFINNL